MLVFQCSFQLQILFQNSLIFNAELIFKNINSGGVNRQTDSKTVFVCVANWNINETVLGVGV